MTSHCTEVDVSVSEHSQDAQIVDFLVIYEVLTTLVHLHF